MSFGNHIIHLNDTKEMPLLGLGTYKTTDDNQLKQEILEAFSCGYHLIDTASFYKNEEGIGKSIKALSIPRSELFITTKLWNTAQRIGNIEDSFYRSLERLGLEYLDLYLIHWPVPGCFCNTWHVLEKLQASGVVKSIGVSNFSVHDLELLKECSDIVPAVNQVELHPLFQTPELVSYCQSSGIALQAYAPLARGAYMNSPLMLEIGNRHQNRSSLACTAEYFCHPKSRPEKSFRRKQQNLRLFSDTGGNVRHFCYEYRTTYHRHSRRYDALMLILNTRSCISYKYAAPFTFMPLSMCYPKTQSSYLLPSILLPQLPALFLQKALYLPAR